MVSPWRLTTTPAHEILTPTFRVHLFLLTCGNAFIDTLKGVLP